MPLHPTLVTMLLGAALTAVGPSQARVGLRPEGSRPPVFTLPDGAGRLISLQSFLGPRRIVLLFGPSAAYLKAVEAESAQFEDRDLTVLAILPPDAAMPAGSSVGFIHTLRDTDGRVAQEYSATDGKPAFYLIGKDGHIAVARHGYPANKELFGIIDAMPMRRREMRERHRRIGN